MFDSTLAGLFPFVLFRKMAQLLYLLSSPLKALLILRHVGTKPGAGEAHSA